MKIVFKGFCIIVVGFLLSAHSCVRFGGVDDNKYSLTSCEGLSSIPNFTEDEAWVFTKDVEPNFHCEGFKPYGVIRKKNHFGGVPDESSFLLSADFKKCEFVVRRYRYCGDPDAPECLKPRGEIFLKRDQVILSLIFHGVKKVVLENGSYSGLSASETAKVCGKTKN